MVGPDGYLPCGLACVPQPLSCVGHSLRQLRLKGDFAAIGRYSLRGAHAVVVFQSSQVGLVNVCHTFINNVARERGDTFFGTGSWPPTGERGEPQVVEATAVLTVIAATPIRTDFGTGCFGILHLYTSKTLIVANKTIPVGTVFTRTASVHSCHKPSCTHRAAAVGIVVVFPWQGACIHASEVGSRYELSASGDTVVHIGKEIIALVEPHLAEVNGQSERHQRMALVTAALLHLSEIAERPSLVGQHHGNKITDELVAAIIQNDTLTGMVFIGAYMVVFIEADTLIVHVYVVTQNTD